MNWIDRKYKEKLGERKFPQSMKEEAWKNAEALLDEQFPISSAKGSGLGWRYILGAVVLAAVIGVMVFRIGSEPQIGSKQAGYYAPRNETLEEPLPLFRESISLEVEDEPINQVERNSIGFKTRGSAMEEAPVQSKAADKSASVSNTTVSVVEVDEKEVGNSLATRKETRQQASSSDKIETTSKPASASSANEANAPSEKPGSRGEAIVTDRFVESDQGVEAEGLNLAPQKAAGEEMSGEKGAPKEIHEKTSTEKTETQTDKEKGRESFEDTAADAVELEPSKLAEVRQAQEGPVEANSKVSDDRGDAGGEVSPRNESWHLAFPKAAEEEDFRLPTLSGRRFAISAWAGYAYTDKFLNSGDQQYIEKRTAEEKAVWTISSGMNFDYFLSGNWTFGIGVGRAEYGENLNYSFSYIDSAYIDGRYDSPTQFGNVIRVDSTRIIDSINKGHWNYDVVFEGTDTAIEKNNDRTHITYAEIPITIGYRIGNGRVKPWLRTGVSIGLPIGSNFRYINSTGKSLSEEGGTVLLAPVQWTYLLNLGIDCKISRHWSIRMNTTGSIHLNSVLGNASAQQRYYRIGGSFGVAYNF